MLRGGTAFVQSGEMPDKTDELEYTFEKGVGWVAGYRKKTLADYVNITITLAPMNMPPDRCVWRLMQRDVDEAEAEFLARQLERR